MTFLNVYWKLLHLIHLCITKSIIVTFMYLIIIHMFHLHCLLLSVIIVRSELLDGETGREVRSFDFINSFRKSQKLELFTSKIC